MLYRSMKRGVSSTLSKNTNFMAPKQTAFGHLRAASMSFKINSGLNKPMDTAASSQYHDQMYEQWRANPSSVDQSWQKHFQQGSANDDISMILNALQSGSRQMGGDVSQAQSDGQKISQYIRAFMTHGHLRADTDPLKLDQTGSETMRESYKKKVNANLTNIEYYGFS